jgi:hypothetical protein
MNTPYIPYRPEEACTCKVCTCREKEKAPSQDSAAETAYISYRERLNAKTPNFGSSKEFAETGVLL